MSVHFHCIFTMFVCFYVFRSHVCYCICLSFITHIYDMGHVAWIKLIWFDLIVKQSGWSVRNPLLPPFTNCDAPHNTPRPPAWRKYWMAAYSRYYTANVNLRRRIVKQLHCTVWQINRKIIPFQRVSENCQIWVLDSADNPAKSSLHEKPRDR